MLDDLPPNITADLADIIYRINPDEFAMLGGPRSPRPLTEEERERIVSLFLRKKWKKLRRFAKRLDRMRAPVSEASRVLNEWIVQELNAAKPEGTDNPMRTRPQCP